MITINKAAFVRTITSLESSEETEFNIKGMSEDQIDLMIRVLSAKKPQDIEDISDDDIVSLFSMVGGFADAMGFSTIFDNIGTNKEGRFIDALNMLPSAKSRRVL